MAKKTTTPKLQPLNVKGSKQTVPPSGSAVMKKGGNTPRKKGKMC